jgi:2-isopropylmalate synthase
MKGIALKDQAAEHFGQTWKVPYLHIDPSDVGREYERLIRINSQSGKGGAAYILEHDFGYLTPKGMHPEIGQMVQRIAESKGLEVDSKELLEAFKKEFLNVTGPFKIMKFERIQSDDPNKVKVHMIFKAFDKEYDISGTGNGPISAAVKAIKTIDEVFDFVLDDFIEQSLGHSADAKAIAYVAVKRLSDNRRFYGAGEHVNIDKAAVYAVVAALNRAAEL